MLAEFPDKAAALLSKSYRSSSTAQSRENPRCAASRRRYPKERVRELGAASLISAIPPSAKRLFKRQAGKRIRRTEEGASFVRSGAKAKLGVVMFDTGASVTCFDQSVAAEIGLAIIGRGQMTTASHDNLTVPFYSGKLMSRIVDAAGRLAAEHDGLWMRRRRAPGALIAVLFVFRLVLSRGTRVARRWSARQGARLRPGGLPEGERRGWKSMVESHHFSSRRLPCGPRDSPPL